MGTIIANPSRAKSIKAPRNVIVVEEPSLPENTVYVLPPKQFLGVVAMCKTNYRMGISIINSCAALKVVV